MSDTPPRRLPWAAICFVACVAIALPGLGDTMFDPKEGDLVQIGARPLSQMWNLGFKNQSHGWPLLMHVWVGIGGTGEWWTRLLSVLLSSLGAVWVFKLGDLLVSRRAGIAAAATFALTPSVLWHMREARMYGLFTALTLGALYYAVAWERSGRRAHLIGAALCTLASVYVHFFGLALAGAIVGFLLIGSSLRTDGKRRERLIAAAVAGAGIVALMIPQLLRVRAGMKYSGPPNAKYGLTGEVWDAALRVGRWVWLNSVGMPRGFKWIPVALLVVGAALFTIGVFQLARSERTSPVPRWWTQAALLLFYFGAGIGLVVLAGRSDVRSRYFCFLAGPMALGIGAALTTPQRRWWLLTWPMAGFLLWASVASAIGQRNVNRGDLDEVIAHITEHAAPNDTIIAVPAFSANLLRLKTGRRVSTRRFVTGQVRKGKLELATDTIWMVHVASQGGDLQTDLLDAEYRLVEQRVGPKSFLQRWSRSTRDAERERDIQRALDRMRPAEGVTRLALTGWWRGTNARQSALGRRLDGATDAMIVRGVRPRGGSPGGSLEPSKNPKIARGPGWRLHAKARRPPVNGGPRLVIAALDLSGWKYKRIPPKAKSALTDLTSRGAVVLRIMPPKDNPEANPMVLAREAARLGARVVTVDGLEIEALERVGSSIVLGELGTFSANRGRAATGSFALIALDADGVRHADVLGAATAGDGSPRADGKGVLHIPPVTPDAPSTPAAKAKFDAGREGTGSSLLELYPARVRAEQNLGPGALRECLPMEGRSFLYQSERGPGNTGSITDRLVCGTNQLKAQWQVTARADHFLGGTARDCLWLHPTGPEPMRMVFDDVALGASLQGRMGVTDTASKKAKGVVQFEVRVDGQPVSRGQVGKKKGWFGWAADTSAFAGGTHDVEFRVTTNKPRWRHFCFDAEVLP